MEIILSIFALSVTSALAYSIVRLIIHIIKHGVKGISSAAKDSINR